MLTMAEIVGEVSTMVEATLMDRPRSVAPAFLVFPRNTVPHGRLIPLLPDFSSDAAKTYSYDQLRLGAIAFDAYAIVSVSEAWGVDIKKGEPFRTMPRDHPNRKEILTVVIAYIDDKTKQMLRFGAALNLQRDAERRLSSPDTIKVIYDEAEKKTNDIWGTFFDCLPLTTASAEERAKALQQLQSSNIVLKKTADKRTLQ